jgi:CheY-like chemotaxis protein
MKRILIVDDEEIFRFTLDALLERNGYECEQAADGAQALHRLFLIKIDLVITDLHMPNLDGNGLIQSMSDNEKWKSIPVICLSGNLSLSENQFKRPIPIMHKPIDERLLLEVIDKILMPEELSSEPNCNPLNFS